MAWAIYSDLSGVTELEGATFATRKDALRRLVSMLEGERKVVGQKLGNARRALTRETRKDQPNDR